jgi:ATP-dependent DNA helicase RecG
MQRISFSERRIGIHANLQGVEVTDQRNTSFTELIQLGESFRCEWKGDLSSKDNKEKICRAICAFANDISDAGLNGVIALGVNNEGLPSNLEITDALESAVLNIHAEGKIVPLPSFVVKRQDYLGKPILIIEITPAISTPVKYDGRIWIRPGNSTRQASTEEERRLSEKRRSKEQPDDCQVLTHQSIDDLNLNYFKAEYLPQAVARDVLEANGRTVEEQLASTKMIGGPAKGFPTVLGMLCLGWSPSDAVPGAYVQFLRIDGTELTDPVIDDSPIHGNLGDVIRATEEKFNAHNQAPVDLTSKPKEQRFPQYPKVALEQLFRNAVLHRLYLGTNSPIRVYWFADRIEITNPGGPYGVVNEQNFGQAGITDYRNPNLAEAMRNLGYVQRFGVGISTANKALSENCNPAVKFSLEKGFVQATIGRRQT